MTHSHLTTEELEFLRTGATREATADREPSPLPRRDATVPIQRAISDRDGAPTERGFAHDLLHGLRAIHEQFARQAVDALRGPLRSPVAIRVERIEQRTYSEIVFDLQNPTCLWKLSDHAEISRRLVAGTTKISWAPKQKTPCNAGEVGRDVTQLWPPTPPRPCFPHPCPQGIALN